MAATISKLFEAQYKDPKLKASIQP